MNTCNCPKLFHTGFSCTTEVSKQRSEEADAHSLMPRIDRIIQDFNISRGCIMFVHYTMEPTQALLYDWYQNVPNTLPPPIIPASYLIIRKGLPWFVPGFSPQEFNRFW